MKKRAANSPKAVVGLPADYGLLLAEIKARVQSARIKAALAANRELLSLYWDIGRLISRAQRTSGYGKQVVERLAADLQREFPGLAGFSALNVWRMRAFYSAYAEMTGILSQPVTELKPATGRRPGSARKLSQPATESLEAPSGVSKAAGGPPEPFASLPWGQNLVLLHQVEALEARLWYAAKAVEHGWSRSVLALQIEAGLHERQGRAVTNFKTTLPPAQSDLAQGITKDPYLFDFLTLREDTNERAVEVGLIAQVEKFLLELGAGFALVGRQVHLEVGDQDFYLDLLFYHLKLRCFVVIDLHPVRYFPNERILLRLCPPQRRRRQSLHWIHPRPSKATERTSTRRCSRHEASSTRRTHLLRGLSQPTGCHAPREVSEDRLGKALPQDAVETLSNGVKARDFTPEAAGKMNFYLSAVDDRLRQPGMEPSIGLILCRSKNRVIAEYALRDLSKPIGVSGYVTKLVDSLPKALKGAVPTVAELEKGLAPDKS